MAKASLVRPDGTKVTIEGAPDEVAALIERLASPSSISEANAQRAARRPTARGRSSRSPARPARGGPTEKVLGLRDEGFFAAKRTLGDLRDRLEEGGHIYARTDVSPILTRLVRQRQLRRLKEGGQWKYVNA